MQIDQERTAVPGAATHRTFMSLDLAAAAPGRPRQAADEVAALVAQQAPDVLFVQRAGRLADHDWVLFYRLTELTGMVSTAALHAALPETATFVHPDRLTPVRCECWHEASVPGHALDVLLVGDVQTGVPIALVSARFAAAQPSLRAAVQHVAARPHRRGGLGILAASLDAAGIARREAVDVDVSGALSAASLTDLDGRAPDPGGDPSLPLDTTVPRHWLTETARAAVVSHGMVEASGLHGRVTTIALPA